jgi:hypothetical protein
MDVYQITEGDLKALENLLAEMRQHAPPTAMRAKLITCQAILNNVRATGPQPTQ